MFDRVDLGPVGRAERNIADLHDVCENNDGPQMLPHAGGQHRRQFASAARLDRANRPE
jgi:hypothetical protein